VQTVWQSERKRGKIAFKILGDGAGFWRQSSARAPVWDVGSWQIVLQKSFCTDDQKF
jgi:hypothetical protein